MNRPFRGKRKDNGEWVYGYYVQRSHKDCCVYHYIYTGSYFEDENQAGTELEVYEVIPETVGQFVCLDKNKDEVYAGDWYKGRLHADNRAKRQVVWYRLAWRGRLPNCPTDIVEYGTIEPNNIELIKD